MNRLKSFIDKNKNILTGALLALLLFVRSRSGYDTLHAWKETMLYLVLLLVFIAFSLWQMKKSGGKAKLNFSALLFALLLSGSYMLTAFIGGQNPMMDGTAGAMLTFLALLCFFYLFYVSTEHFWLKSERLSSTKPAKLIWLLVPMLVFALCLLSQYQWFYPAGSSPDTRNQWMQLHGELKYNKIHAIGHTIFLKMLLTLHDSFGVAVMAHFAGLVLIYTLFYDYFRKKGFSANCLLIVFSLAIIISAASSNFAYYVPWKDTPAALCLAFVTYIILLYNDSGKLNCALAALLGLALAWCWLFRLNGIIAFLVCSVYFVCSFLKRKYYRQLAAMLIAAAISAGFVNVYSAAVLKPEEHENGFSIQVFGSGIAAMVNSGELSEQELAQVDELISVDWMRDKYCWYDKTHLIWEKDNSPAIISVPEMEIFNNQFVLDMGANKKDVIFLYLKLMPKHFAVCVKDVLGSIYMMWQTHQRFMECYFFQFLLMVFLAFKAKLGRKELLVFMPSLCNTVSIMISTITNESRYLLPAFMLMPVFFLYLVWKNIKYGGQS